jgi:hypothetical protein
LSMTRYSRSQGVSHMLAKQNETEWSKMKQLWALTPSKLHSNQARHGETVVRYMPNSFTFRGSDKELLLRLL